MSDRNETSHYCRTPNQYHISARLFGPLRLAAALDRQKRRVIKAHVDDRDYFTDITISDGRLQGGLVVDYLVTAASPDSALRVGTV